MRDKIDGYGEMYIIKGYKIDNNNIIVEYLGGSRKIVDISLENDIIILMEEQGIEYSKGCDKKRNFIIKKVLEGSISMGVLFGTLQMMELLCTSQMFNNFGIIIGSGVGSILISGDVIFIKNICLDLINKINRFDNQEKYKYYFDNKELLYPNVNINNIDSYTMSRLCDIVEGFNINKKLKKKR